MAMSEKQINRRMNEAWESHFMQHDSEAEWYANEESNVWICDIPSLSITVKMELKEEYKDIVIYQAKMEKQSDYRQVRDTEWQVVGHYSW